MERISGTILIVCTSHDAKVGSQATGASLSDIACAYKAFHENGYKCLVATPKGGAVPINEESMAQAETGKAGHATTHFLTDDSAMQLLMNSVPLHCINKVAGVFSAVFVAGGRGALFDLPNEKALINLLAEANTAGVAIAAISHGLAALVNVPACPDGTGGPLVKGHTIACNKESLPGKDPNTSALLEDCFRSLGAEVVTCSERVIASRKLITSQSPDMSQSLASTVVETLAAQYPEAHAANAPPPHSVFPFPALFHTGGGAAHSLVEVPSRLEQHKGEEEKPENVMNPSYDDNIDFGQPDPSTGHDNEAKG